MKRVALIRNSYSYDLGGAEIFPINLAKILASEGYEPVVLSSNRRTLALAESSNLNTVHSLWWSAQNQSGLRILIFPAYVVWVLAITLWYFLFFLKNHIDTVCPQSRDDFVGATIAAKLLRKKVIWTDHADLKHIYANHTVWYKNPVGKLVYVVSLLADHVTLESNSEKRLVEKALSKKLPRNYSVIHIGVVDSYKPSTHKSTAVILVATSRLVKDKGIGELIEAMKSINNKDIRLKLCGTGPEEAHFKALAKGIKNIEFLGHVDDVTQVLKDGDIFVHPTYHEGFGLSLVEAEMYSLPIIASNVGSIPEIVEDQVSGILVPSKNAQELAKAIKILVENPELRTKMGQAGREIYLKNFQFDEIVKNRFIPLL
jgi:glycosyltransferase involved in cell wall biosynthesis